MSRENVLYIEDNPADAALFSALIAQASGGQWQVVSAARLDDACRMLAVRSFSAVLVDLNLPGSSGAQTVEEVKRHCPDLPVIAFTAVDDDRLADEIVELGAQDYIVKGSSDGAELRRRIQHSILRQHYESRLFFSANYDEITGLPKYQLFLEHLHHAIPRARRQKEMLGVILMEINDLHALTDRYGMEVGGRVVKELGERIRRVVRGGDVLARYGSDTLALLVEGMKQGRGECLQIAGKILRALETPFGLPQGQWTSISLCMGMALTPLESASAQHTLACARRSLAAAKERGKGSIDIYDAGNHPCGEKDES